MPEQDGVQLELFPKSEMEAIKQQIETEIGSELIENLEKTNPGELELEFPN